MQPRILIIIPVFNESANIINIGSALRKLGYDCCFIDDGSTDETHSLLIENDFQHYNHEINLGQGAALRSGFNYAVEKGYQIVVHFDGDGQHRIKDIDKVVAPILLHNVDIVFGSRFLNRQSIKAIPWSKRNILRIARVFEGFRSGIWLSDAHCGLRALNVNTCQRMTRRANGMAHASEIVSETKKHNLKYTEVSVYINYFDTNKNENNLKRISAVIKELLSS